MRTSLIVLAGLAWGCGSDSAPSIPDAQAPADARLAEPDAPCAAADSTTFYGDVDGDGYGDPNFIAVDCVQPAGFVDNQLDCNDTDPRDNPDGTELCDGIDNDCDPATAEVCPDLCSPQLRGTNPYLFCNQGLSQSNAQLACAGQDMHLVRIDDMEEQVWLSEQRVVAFGAKRTAWHGGTDRATEDTWLWADGEGFWQGRAGGAPIGGLFTFWRGGEPNNSDGEDCALLNDNATGSWDDRGCGTGVRFICERNLPPE